MRTIWKMRLPQSRHYHTKTQERFTELLAQQPDKFGPIRSLFQALPPPEPPTADQPQSSKGLSNEGTAAFIRAVNATNPTIFPAQRSPARANQQDQA